MATIVHFDIPADDPERAKRFYEALFGWKITFLPGPINYYLIETRDLNGSTGIGGGIAKRTESEQTGITNFIGVQSIDETIAKLTTIGGKLVQPKQEVPGYGFLAVCRDSENNLFGLFEENKTNIIDAAGQHQNKLAITQ